MKACAILLAVAVTAAAPTTSATAAIARRLEPIPDYLGGLALKGPLELRLSKLRPQAELTRAPWPGDYWPAHRDGINFQWNASQPSATDKYARAFGLDAAELAAEVSKTSGVLWMQDRPPCRSNQDCEPLQDGSVCGFRPGVGGAVNGRCIPDWIGICNGWAAAAIAEPEPKCPVTLNGVTFEPLDIKALVSKLYSSTELDVELAGDRFLGYDVFGAPVDGKDRHGRYGYDPRRALNPGTFHVALGNLIGRWQFPFAVDVDAGAPVWNHPVLGYKVLEHKVYRPAQAAARFFPGDAALYAFNPEATKLVYVRSNVT